MTLTTRHISRIAAIIMVALVALAISLHSALASPYDNFSAQPGDRIENDISVSWGDTGTSPDPIFASDEIEIIPFSTPGTLRAFMHDPAGAPYAVQPAEISHGDESGPFGAAPAPLDASGSAISLSGSVSLSETNRILKGTTVFLVLQDEGLNFSASSRESVIVSVMDSITGDTEHLRMHETGADTGEFIGYFQTVEGDTVARDGIINTHPHARIDALYTDPWRATRSLDDLVLVGPVDPYGVFFDSRTGLPVDGVRVTLIDDATGNPATVYGEDLVASYPATVVTGTTVTDSSGRSYALDRGEYRFPFVDLGTYRLEVEAPIGYAAPSLVENSDLQTLTGAPFALGPGSRLDAFDVVAGPPIEIDVPLDGEGFISVTRNGSADSLEIGDFIQFTVTVGTNLPADITGIVHDTLPAGLSILPETLLVNDALPAAAPVLSDSGREASFPDILFPNGGVAKITYVAQVSPQAQEDTVLTSTSTANAHRLMANTASHDLEIAPVFMRDSDIVIGQVFATGCAATHDPDLDLSGIRLMLEDGRFVETDKSGRFTFRNISRGAHVLALDPISVPRGYEPVLCQNTTQKAGSAVSRFIEARGGLSRQVFFHLKPAKFYDNPGPIAPALKTSAAYDIEWLKRSPSARGLVFPSDGYLPAARSIDIIGVRGEGNILTAYVNDEKAPALNRRPPISGPGGTAIETWKGVPLRSGINVVRLVTNDASGKLLREDVAQVLHNGTVSKIQVVEEASILSSDGRTRPVVTFRLTNDDDIPLHPGTIANISVDAPHKFSTTTVDKDGTRTEAELGSATGTVDADGLLRLRLAPVRKPGTATFRVFTESGSAHAKAYVATEGRPFILVGLAAGTLSHDTISEHMRAPGEAALGSLGNLDAHGRTSFYAQGVIRGKWLITARYDSALRQRSGDFFDIDPEADYIVYGDKSIEGDAASSRHPLYLRIEGDNGEILYGDFDTGINAGVATYARRLTGARALFGNDTVSLTAFLTDTSQSFVEDSFPADGTSGPFMLSRDGILPFSESVHIETTSRTDPGQVIDSRTLERGRDYDIDYRAGRVFLAEPLMSRDSRLNPNAVIIRYEIDSQAGDGIVIGGRATLSLGESVTLGGTAVHEDNIAGSDGAGVLAGADLTWKINDHLTGTVALGYSHQDASSTLASGVDGFSGEARLQYAGDAAEIEAYIRSEDTTFGIQNQEDSTQNVISGGLNGSMTIASEEIQTADGEAIARSQALGAALHAERNQSTGDEKLEAEISYTRQEGLTLRGIGLRAEHAETGTAQGSGLKLFGTAEHETSDGRLRLALGQEVTLAEAGDLAQPDRGTLEVEYDATDAVTLKATHEIAFDDDLRVNILGLGADVAIWEGATLSFGTMTAASSAGSHTVGHAGLDQEVELEEGTRLRFGIERQAPIAGDFDTMGPISEAGLSNPRLEEGFWAINAGFDRAGDIWTTSGLSEYRVGEEGDQYRLRLTAGRDLRDDLAFGAKTTLFSEEASLGGWDHDYEAVASLAWRPHDARFVVLDQLRARHEKDSSGIASSRLVNSLYYSRQLEGGHEVNLRHGLKLAQFDFASSKHRDVLNLVGGEYRHQLLEWADIGLHGAALHSMQSGSFDYSAGASIGITPFENGWLSAGYNWTGFVDEDFAAGGQTAEGAFLQFRIKFDQKSLRRIVGQ